VAFAIREAVEALRSAGHEVARARLVGGGTRHPLWRGLLADVLGLSLTVVARPDASARGAARLALLGLGIPFETAADEVEEVVEPSPDRTRYEEAFARFRARVPFRAWPERGAFRTWADCPAEKARSKQIWIEGRN
jgi:sugar (pentulose or hexulose) kinase